MCPVTLAGLGKYMLEFLPMSSPSNRKCKHCLVKEKYNQVLFDFQSPSAAATSKQNGRGLVDPRAPLDNLKKLVSQGDPDAGKLLRFVLNRVTSGLTIKVL